MARESQRYLVVSNVYVGMVLRCFCRFGYLIDEQHRSHKVREREFAANGPVSHLPFGDARKALCNLSARKCWHFDLQI
jgi:hypothetical protein